VALFALKGDEPRPMFSFAGIWQRWRGSVKKDRPNVEIDVYSIMTTMPNSATASSARGEIGVGALPSALRRALASMSASAKNGRRACA
jgi:hypothetical protein